MPSHPNEKEAKACLVDKLKDAKNELTKALDGIDDLIEELEDK